MEADLKKRKRAEHAESRREEKQIEAQIGLARELEAARDGTGRRGRQDNGDGSSSQQLSVHSSEKPLQLSIGAHRGQGEEAEHSGRGVGGRGQGLFDDKSRGLEPSEGRAALAAPSDADTSSKRSKVRLLHSSPVR